MSRRKTAKLSDGTTIDYIETDTPPSGTMKKTYFTPDRSQVVQFFLDQSVGKDKDREARLRAILGKYNATLAHTEGGSIGTTEQSADYFRKLFCWPTGIVVEPEIGIVAPTYPDNFFFASGQWKGQEKKGRWFQSAKLRPHLPKEERGDWMKYLSICIYMARAIRRLHQAGLAHSDLSSNNVLIDPVSGQSIIIDIDSLVVPGIYPPDVLGTAGFIAPELLMTQHLQLEDPKRNHPNVRSDLHALAVLIYENLLQRHPLRGPKVNSANSPEEDERLSMGEKALFVEHPTDTSNRPKDIRVPYTALGPFLSNLITQTFIDGLRNPDQRPVAIQWEQALTKTWDLVHPCLNPKCEQKWFVLYDEQQKACPFCGTKVKQSVPTLRFRRQVRQGTWVNDGQLTVYDGLYFFKWHAYSNTIQGEAADRKPLGYCSFYEGKWIMFNQNLPYIITNNGNRVPPGQALELKDGDEITFPLEHNGRKAIVQFVQV